ncbi:methyltransferase domain-containing protein [Kribbella shirazensis]|uniref:23S rRNA G2445 N2-methylase RlmL n=1 Tax=Kribbella shirazensis TaxID=1105143 RepID=A0A7X5VAL3_9ACTN|nr:methyltransferase domain-containing protein [Kribbella shirazensis]NIK57705.1 23S rRNA G2445 N2-methylase RlmL [Kribbella shirazensis]
MRSALVLVRVVAGLEWLAAEEVVAAGHRVVEVSKRLVVVEPSSDAIVERPPRVADDLFVVRGTVVDPGRTKAGLVAAVRSTALGSGERGAFAVSASFVGERNFNRFDVEDLVGERIARLTGGRYHSRRGGIVPPDERAEWRVVLDGKTLWIGVRPYAVPLHRRAWRTRTVPGSLHPPVAAAMARLAQLAPGHDVLDPFCGAGTLLLEARLLEPRAEYVGLDRDPAAIAAARANAARASACDRTMTWSCADTRRLTGSADRMITNPPWNRRVRIGDLAPYLRAWRRVLDGRLVAILTAEQAAGLGRGWRIEARYDVAVAGRHPVIVVAEASRG